MCVILLQGQRKLFFVSPTSSRKRQSKLDKTRKTLNNQMAPRGCGRQQVWTYAGWQVFWGGEGVTTQGAEEGRGDVWQGNLSLVAEGNLRCSSSCEAPASPSAQPARPADPKPASPSQTTLEERKMDRKKESHTATPLLPATTSS